MAVNQINSPPTITKVGLKLATMNNNQHLSLTITHAAFGTEKYRPTGEETSLKQERLRVGIASAVRLDEKTIQMRFVVKAEQDEGFWCNEIGFWANNTLIAVYSSDEIKGEGLIFISDKVETTISFSLALEAMPVERIDVQIMQDQDKLIQLINQHENEDNPHPQYTPKTLTATSQNAVEETGHSHEIDKASTSQAGIVQLTNATDSEAETLGLTAKAGKTLKGLIDALTRNLGNYIPNSKKSNAINSPSGDTVATSKAVNQLNELKADKATTLAGYGITDFAQRALTASDNLNDITVKGLYRNTSYLNTTNNNYPENASGVLFVLSSAEQVYFSITGKIWKRFKDTNNWANGWARVDGNAIFEEGGMIKKTLVLNETLVMKRLFAGNQAREWANYHTHRLSD
ncbi:pyocin knob domain-containing protein [Avibacterium paragallinarum]|uniref:pyocin knob domain-containing protein n=1 Tax=Avibacterium paragallinarum TaxID=728 RepID=UPI0022863A77|nr:pyocin knob domain-containing protein [Avibacterium paragallinarum]WAM59154.1 pyocin knob domain-containing protein [Avibacterium paragallinarum]